MHTEIKNTIRKNIIAGIKDLRTKAMVEIYDQGTSINTTRYFKGKYDQCDEVIDMVEELLNEYD